jgi:hypothetical protein
VKKVHLCWKNLNKGKSGQNIVAFHKHQSINVGWILQQQWKLGNFKQKHIFIKFKANVKTKEFFHHIHQFCLNFL